MDMITKCGASAKANDGTEFVPATLYNVASRNIGVVHYSAEKKIITVYSDHLYASPEYAEEAACRMRDAYDKRLLFSEYNTRIENDYDRDDDGNFVFLLETWFDPFAKYGVPAKEDEDTWINTYAILNYGTKQVSVVYYIDSPDDCVEGHYDPTPEESKTLLNLILNKFGKDLEKDSQERGCVNVCT